jgi:hypothetical protein
MKLVAAQIGAPLALASVEAGWAEAPNLEEISVKNEQH